MDQPLHGSLGFLPNGNLITAASGLVDGLDSRLKMPNQLKLNGPQQEVYGLSPVSDAYFNNWDAYHQPATNTGFINFAGLVDVPFFEPIQAHIQTSARTNDVSAPIYLMGGWPNHGWNDAADGTNFFTGVFFDANNIGYPVSQTSLEGYRHSATERYHVRARQDWVAGIGFEFPLDWDASSRSFRSFAPVTTNFLLISTPTEVKYMSASQVDLTFGQRFGGLPRMDFASLGFNENGANGVASADSTAITEAKRTAILQGMNRLQLVLRDQLHGFLKPVFSGPVETHLGNLAKELADAYAILQPGDDWNVIASGIVQPYIGTFNDYLYYNFLGTPASGGVVQQLDQSIAAVQDAIAALQNTLLAPDHSQAKTLARQLIVQLAPDYLSAWNDTVADGSLQAVEPALAEIRAALSRLSQELAEYRNQLGDGKPGAVELAAELNWTEIQALDNRVKTDILELLDQWHKQNSPLSEHPELKGALRQKFEDRFFASALEARLQAAFKKRLYDKDAAIREAFDSTFQQINQVVRDVVSPAVAQADNTFAPFRGMLGKAMSYSRIAGYAHINGDSLDELRLDGRLQWKVPETLEFNGYLRIRHLQSDGTDSCQSGGAAHATEVTLGADSVPLSWISDGMKANVGGKFTFDDTGKPLGMVGSLALIGVLNFEAFRVNNFAAMLAFGEQENYLSATAAVQFQDYKLSGGMYFGRTCTLDPIRLWDPQVADLLGNPPFTGAYVYAEGWMPIFGASCLFNISAGVGAGAFYFVEGPTYGGKMMAGVSGEALCLVSVQGDIHLVGVKQGGDFRFNGQGHVKGKAGACPFCVKFSKSVGVTYQNGSWSVSY